ncbi:MAG: 4-hydroxy-3-methylbut-2-enyl diphosphate reductase [Spirochaetes bacterium GWF1_41_5]|nr:MAG: 4-hydroxy-3-methylbut-2-enyl diphosphate reductase [Spirochaetes bacterium GWF1_41_5]HBE00921.1 4-hydroxy-3-methylbut-2-enyl diphosphate reductase [Spirochaetia bacterium]
MKIVLAESAGFCSGVKEAVNKALRSSYSLQQPLYSCGELIHNQKALEFFQKFNIFSLHKIDEIPADRKPGVIIRTHGVSPDDYARIREKAGLIINATCKKVAAVQGSIKKFSRRGYFTVITGQSNHPEVTGLQGYATGGFSIISGKDEALAFLADAENIKKKILLVSQTTYSVEKFDIIAALFREKMTDQNLVVINTICAATRIRQYEAGRLAADCSHLLVIGDRNSSNTCKLYDIGKAVNPQTYFIESADDLKNLEFPVRAVIGITAGASAPSWLISDIVAELEKRCNSFGKKIQNLFSPLIMLDVFNGLHAGLISVLVLLLAGAKAGFLFPAAAFFYICGIYNFHHLTDPAYLSLIDYRKSLFFSRHKKPVAVFTVLMLTLALTAGSLISIASADRRPAVFLPLILVCLLLFFSIVYYRRYLIIRYARRLPGSKTIFETIVWALAVLGIPLTAGIFPRRFSGSYGLFPAVLLSFYFPMFKIIFANLRTVNEDKIFNFETFAVSLGIGKTILLLSMAGIALLLISAAGMVIKSGTLPGLIAGVLCSLLLLLRVKKIISIKNSLVFELITGLPVYISLISISVLNYIRE